MTIGSTGWLKGRTGRPLSGAAVEKVTHQAQTLKGKWQGRRRHAVRRADLAEGAGDGDAHN